MVVKLQLPAETGALLLKALEVALPEIPLPADCEGALHVSAETSMGLMTGDPPTLSARRADALDVGRKARSIPPALRRALKSRDKGCVFPGCGHMRYVDGHHIHHWAEGGLSVQRLDDGAWRFTNRHGVSVESCVTASTRPLGDWSCLVAANVERGLQIDAQTAATRWRGERMDYGIAVDSLLYRTRPSPPVISAR